MNRLATSLIAASLSSGAVAAEWTYRVRTDSFENVEQRTAVLIADSGGATLEILHTSIGSKLAFVSSRNTLNCFPTCTMRIKFDDASPVDFVASTSKPLSVAARLSDYERFERMLGEATRVVVRAPHMRAASDISFTVGSRFDPSKWEAARVRQAKEARCQANAVNEDYSICMKRD